MDNLSRGRAGIAFAAGFHPNDFLFDPDAYAERREIMFERSETWAPLARRDRQGPRRPGQHDRCQIFPKPVQPEMPIWVTRANNPQTFADTGRNGAKTC